MKKFIKIFIYANIVTALILLLAVLCTYIVKGVIDIQEVKMVFSIGHIIASGVTCICGLIVLMIGDDWESIQTVIDYAKEDESWLVKEVGFVLEETDEYLLLASQITVGGSVGNAVKIPTTWIRKRIELSDAVK